MMVIIAMLSDIPMYISQIISKIIELAGTFLG